VILAVVFLASVVAPFNQFKIPPIMPVLMQAFHIDLTQAGVLMSIVAMIGLVLALPAGILLQRFGAKLVGLIALGCLAVGAGLGAQSLNYPGLLGSRVVEGIGMGLIGVAAPATIAMWFPAERQGMPMGIWATWVPVGSVTVYNLAPLLAARFNWGSVWWVGAIFAVVMFLLYAVFVRQPPEPQPDVSPGPVPAGVSHALSNRNIWLLALEFACFNIALVGLSTYYPTFLNEVRGYPLGRAAFLSSLATMLVIVSAPLAGWLSDRVGSRRLVFSLPFLGIAVLLLFPFHVVGWQIPALMITQGLLVGAIPTATFTAAPEIMRKPHLAGLGLAVVLVGQYLGQLIAPILFSQLATSLGWAMAGYLMIPVCLLGFASAWSIKIR
jgi:MFS family permease